MAKTASLKKTIRSSELGPVPPSATRTYYEHRVSLVVVTIRDARCLAPRTSRARVAVVRQARSAELAGREVLLQFL